MHACACPYGRVWHLTGTQVRSAETNVTKGDDAPPSLTANALDEIARGDFHLSTLREREAGCAASDDLREGRLAMAEKRPPRFSGR
jgi:hypothetical protein